MIFHQLTYVFTLKLWAETGQMDEQADDGIQSITRPPWGRTMHVKALPFRNGANSLDAEYSTSRMTKCMRHEYAVIIVWRPRIAVDDTIRFAFSCRLGSLYSLVISTGYFSKCNAIERISRMS